MLYLGIDQHRKQLTVSLRNQAGEVILRRQVSTKPVRIRKFLEDVRKQAAKQGGVYAVLEVCGFNDWLIEMLGEYDIEVVLIQPEKQSKKKTDRRDAHSLSELLWVNRDRLREGQPVQGARQVHMVSQEELADRRLTASRHRLGQQRTRTINKIKQILRRHNLEWECPTKTFNTLAVRAWLKGLSLPPAASVPAASTQRETPAAAISLRCHLDFSRSFSGGTLTRLRRSGWQGGRKEKSVSGQVA